MNKEELVNYMKASREILNFSESSQAWKRAFVLIRQNGYENLDMECKKCLGKVQKWLLE